MAKSFYKEEFMSQPVEVEFKQEVEELEFPNTRIMPFVHEQSVILHIGGQDYDVRDLVWRIRENETEINELRSKVDFLMNKMFELESRVF